METKQIEINDKVYTAYIADTEDLRSKGLSNAESIDSNELMLFIFDQPIPAEDVIFTSEDMSFDLDILFLDPECNIVDKQFGKAGSEDPITPTNLAPDMPVAYVIELNANSGVNVGDEVDLEPEEASDEEVDKLYVLDENGNPQYEILAGARIVSRIETRKLIQKAKKARKSKLDKDYKALGKFMFKVLEGQDNRPSEYVELE